MPNPELEDHSAYIAYAVREQLLVLDADLRVRAASGSFYRAFRVGPEETLGRRLDELGNGQWNIPVLRALLEELPPLEGEINDLEVALEFPTLGRRTMLLSARRLSGGDPRGGMILLAIQDCTGHRCAEAEVDAQVNRYRTTLASICDAVIVTDPESRITFMNPTAERITGWGQEEALQKPLADIFNIVNEQSSRPVQSPVAKAIRDGAIVGLANHTVLIARDGTEWPIDDSAAPIWDANGRIVGVVLVFHDITNRRKAEHELEISEVRYRRLFEAAHDGILILDTETAKVMDVNRFMVDLLNYPREYFLGKELWELGVFHDAESNKAAMERLRKVGSIRYDDLPLKHKDGRHIPVEFVSNVYREGRRSVIQCNIRDITERKQAAAASTRIAAIVESSGDAIISETLGGIISTWNPASEVIFGYTSAEALGSHISILLPPQGRDEEMRILERIKRGERVEHYETLRVAKDGRLVNVSLSVSPVRDSANRIVGTSKILRDITGQMRAEVELSRAKEAAEAANRSKSEFLANMSHEIRTPMSAIMGFSERLLHDDQDEAGRKEYVQIIRRNSSHLLEIINEILDLSKIEASQMTVERIECDLPDLLSEIISLLRPRAADKGLGFEITFEGPIPRVIRTDPLRLRQILVNLLGNALKFTPVGKIAVRVTDEAAGSDRIQMRIDVTDTGIGMAPELLGRLFQPFNQGDESITRKFGGTGLGLTISRRLARLINGDVTVVSAAGSGSTFTLTVDGGPSAGVEMLNGLTETTLVAKMESAAHPRTELNGRILLVEDGRDNQRLLRMQLRDAGAAVFTADNGQIAVYMAATQPFDLIVMDMQMPVMDGYAATIELRRMGLKIPIIALTAYAMAEDRAKCIASGCSDYLSKPVDEEKLLKTVNQLLENNDTPLPNRSAATAIAGSPPPPGAADGSDRIKSSVAGNPRMMKIIPEFVDGLPGKVRKMIDLLERNELAALQQVVHQLLGACGGYGFTPVSEPASRAEEAIRAGKALESITAEVRSLIEVIRRIDGYDESKATVAAEEPAK